MRELKQDELNAVSGGGKDPLPPGNAFGWYVNDKAKGKAPKDAPSGIQQNDKRD